MQQVLFKMSQLVKIKTTVFHVPSIARLRLTDTTILGRPLIVVQTHAAQVTHMTYGIYQWKEATADYKRLQQSMDMCREALKSIPMLEPTVDAEPVNLQKELT